MISSSALKQSLSNILRNFTAYTLLSMIFLCSNFTSKAQEKKDGATYKERKNVIMKEQISILKNGSLLVRLKTKSNTIKALKEIGDTVKANLVNENQNNLNKKIISAFKNNFTFSPVYFFFSDYSDTIRNHKFNDVSFLNEDLVADPTIKPGSSRFLTAEFGNVLPDTASYFSGSYLAQSENGLKREESYYGSTDTKLIAIIIMSDQFIQLCDPFPYYVKVGKEDPTQKGLDNAVKKLNAKLVQYYSSSNQ